jgi:uncharacterized protein (DUF433 family)
MNLRGRLGACGGPLAWRSNRLGTDDTARAYPADRAAALAGVPLSTVHWWARNAVLVPSISAQRVKLWSFSDLMGLRMIYWLRQTKMAPDGAAVPRTAMPAVRRALEQIGELDLRLWSEDSGPAVAVDRGGNVVILSDPQRRSSTPPASARCGLQRSAARHCAVCDRRGLARAGPARATTLAPHCARQTGGSPHVAHTRLESQALAALDASGVTLTKIYRLYPHVGQSAIDEALDLERELVRNLQPAA